MKLNTSNERLKLSMSRDGWVGEGKPKKYTCLIDYWDPTLNRMVGMCVNHDGEHTAEDTRALVRAALEKSAAAAKEQTNDEDV
jgi:hypothetical protein